MNNTIDKRFFLSRDGKVVGGYDDIDVSNCVAISRSNFHALGLSRDGQIVGWGSNANRQINCPSGIFISSPHSTIRPSRVKANE